MRDVGIATGVGCLGPAADPKAAADAVVAGIAREKVKGVEDGERLLDRACRCEQRRRLQAYAQANPAIFKKFGGKFIIRGGKFEAPEGTSRSRNVVIEFPDYAAAHACYMSPEYQANIKVRQPHSVADILIIEGYDGPQP